MSDSAARPRTRSVLAASTAVSAGLHFLLALAAWRAGLFTPPPPARAAAPAATAPSSAASAADDPDGPRPGGDPSRGALERLRAAEAAMKALRDARLREYARAAAARAATADKDVAAALAEALRHQEEVLKALESGARATEADRQRLFDALSAAARAQEKAGQALAFSPRLSGEKRQAQQAQSEAARAQTDAEAKAREAVGAAEQGDAARAQEAVRQAAEAQRTALDAQRRAAEATARPEGAPPDAPSEAEVLAAAREQLGKAAPSGGAPSDEHAAAVQAERQLDAAYRDARALELAGVRGIPVAEALQSVRTETPQRTAGGPGADDAERRAELAAMAARAQRLLDQAQRAPGSEAAALVARMENLARQETGREQDVAGLMAASGAASDGARGEDDPRRLPGGAEYVPPPPPPALSPDALARAVPCRRLAAPGSAPAADWMFLDSWYTLGPFPNPDRSNINTPFGPEDGIDLDATYTGKDNKPLRWRFVQTATPQIVPADPQQYGVYYAYTELFSATERDAWVAIGSDDKSHLWVNGRPVWVSSDNLKGWNPGEGLRRVHLLRGRNRLLLRCENGWRGVGFSVVVSVK